MKIKGTGSSGPQKRVTKPKKIQTTQRKSLPGYKVPSKLLKSTKANKTANKRLAKKQAAQYNMEDLSLAKKNVDAVRINALKPKVSGGKVDEMAQANKLYVNKQYTSINDAIDKVQRKSK